MVPYSKIIVALGVGTVLPLAALSQEQGARSVTVQDEFQTEANPMVVGGAGGNWVAENPSTYMAGPITAVKICAGTYVDSIQFRYGSNSWGQIFGGPGGDCAEQWELQRGEQIKSIRVRSGDVIDSLEFITTLGTHTFGGKGGNPTMVVPAGEGSLAYVEGSAGNYVNRLKFVFGLPYYITDFSYDKQHFKDIIQQAPIKALQIECLVNNTSVPQSKELTMEKSVRTSESYEFGLKTSWGVSQSVTLGSEELGVEAETAVTVNQEIDSRQSTTKEETVTKSDKTTIVAPEHSTVIASLQAQEAVVDIPYTYNIVHYRGANQTQPVLPKRGPFKGTYSAVRYGGATIVYDTAPACPAGMEPIKVWGDSGSATTASTSLNPSSTPYNAAADAATSVSYVSATNGRANVAYRQRSDGLWEETNGDETVVNFTFREVGRDADTIDLVDVNRGVLIGLDLDRGRVSYAPNASTAKRDIFTITGSR